MYNHKISYIIVKTHSDMVYDGKYSGINEELIEYMKL